MAITRSTPTGWLQDLDSVGQSRATPSGWVEATASAGGGIVPGSSEGAITGNEPAALVTNNAEVSPGSVAGAVTTHPPVVLSDGSAVAQPDIQSVIATGSAPEVALSDNRVVQAGSESVVVAGEQPSVFVSDHAQADPSSGAVSIVGYTPGIVVVTPSVWRIRFHGNNNVSGVPTPYLQVTELQLLAGGTDQCTGGEASATSVFSGTYPASNAFDDSTSTRWVTTSADSDDEVFLQYVFPGTVASVDTYTINALSASNQPTFAPRQWWLEESVDGSWVARDYQYEQGSWGSTETREFTPGVADINRCYGGTATASSENNAANNVDLLFKGTPSDLDWISATLVDPPNADEWVEYDFGSGVTHEITKYQVQCRRTIGMHQPESFRFQYYNGSTWVDLDTRTGLSWTASETKEFTISSPVTAQRFRLYIDTVVGSYTLVALGRLRMFSAVEVNETRTITTASGSVSFAASAPAVLTDREPGAASLVVSGYAPGVGTGVKHYPGSVQVSLSPSAPTLEYTQNHYSSPQPGSVLLPGAAPQLFEGMVRAPGSGAASITTQTPNAVQNELTAPPSAAVLFARYDVALQCLFASAPGEDSLSVTSIPPAVVVETVSSRQPAAYSMQVSLTAPSLFVAVEPRPGSVVAAVSGLQPTASVNGVELIGHGALSILGNVTGLSIGTVASPGGAALSVGGVDPTPVPGVVALVGVAVVEVLPSAASALEFKVASAGAGWLTVVGYAPNVASTSPRAGVDAGSLVVAGSEPSAMIGLGLVLNGNPPSIGIGVPYSLSATVNVGPVMGVKPQISTAVSCVEILFERGWG